MLDGRHWEDSDCICLPVEDEEFACCHFGGSKRLVGERGNEVHDRLVFAISFDSMLRNEDLCGFRQEFTEGGQELMPESLTVHVINFHGKIFHKFALDFLKTNCQTAAETFEIISLSELVNSLKGHPIFLQEAGM